MVEVLILINKAALCWVLFHYTDFHQNFPAGEVTDTDHESRRLKR